MESVNPVVEPCKDEMAIQSSDEKICEQSIQRSIESLMHACLCKDAYCPVSSCQPMKRVVCHTNQCQRKTNGDCIICRQLVALCYHHCKSCQEDECVVPFCRSVRNKLEQKNLEQGIQEMQLSSGVSDDVQRMTIDPSSTTMAANSASQSKEEVESGTEVPTQSKIP